MAEMTELETETEQSSEEAAATLRQIADELEAGDAITVEGNDAMITVPGTEDTVGTCLEVEHEIRGEYDQVEIEIEFDWTIIPDDDEE